MTLRITKLPHVILDITTQDHRIRAPLLGHPTRGNFRPLRRPGQHVSLPQDRRARRLAPAALPPDLRGQRQSRRNEARGEAGVREVTTSRLIRTPIGRGGMFVGESEAKSIKDKFPLRCSTAGGEGA